MGKSWQEFSRWMEKNRAEVKTRILPPQHKQSDSNNRSIATIPVTN